jgi:Ni/Co efflux regulator RcnB
MKKLVLTALALSVVSTPALAQKGNKDSEPLAILEGEKKRQAEQLDQQYNRQMERSRKEGNTAAARSDPWANMRAPNDGKR